MKEVAITPDFRLAVTTPQPTVIRISHHHREYRGYCSLVPFYSPPCPGDPAIFCASHCTSSLWILFLRLRFEKTLRQSSSYLFLLRRSHSSPPPGSSPSSSSSSPPAPPPPPPPPPQNPIIVPLPRSLVSARSCRTRYLLQPGPSRRSDRLASRHPRLVSRPPDHTRTLQVHISSNLSPPPLLYPPHLCPPLSRCPPSAQASISSMLPSTSLSLSSSATRAPSLIYSITQ